MLTLPTAIKEFLNHCKFEKGLTPKTIKAYQIDLKQLLTFLYDKKYSVLMTDIGKAQLREYLEVISPLKRKSIKRKVATIKAMFNFLEFEDKITVNPLRKMRIKIRESKQLPRVLDISEVKGILTSAYSRKNAIVDRNTYAFQTALLDIAVIELLFATGARVSEIANIKADQIDLTSGIVILKGKGNKERIIQICNNESLKILGVYYRTYRQRIIRANGYFLVNRFNNKLSDQSIRNTVKSLSKKAGITKHITPHAFRHTFATLLLERDVDIKYIQLLLGHSSIMTTQIYTHVNKAKQRAILKDKHPRRDFSMYPSANAG